MRRTYRRARRTRSEETTAQVRRRTAANVADPAAASVRARRSGGAQAGDERGDDGTGEEENGGSMWPIQQQRVGAPDAAAVHRRATSGVTTAQVRRRTAGRCGRSSSGEWKRRGPYCAQVGEKRGGVGAGGEREVCLPVVPCVAIFAEVEEARWHVCACAGQNQGRREAMWV